MPLQPKVTEIVLDSGVRVWVAPLSRFQRNALTERAAEVFPYPDKADYEESLSEDIAIPGMKIPAEDNKDYQLAVGLVNRRRQDLTNTGVLNICLSFPDYPDRAELIKEFAPFLDMQREFMALPEDAWTATLRFAIVRSQGDEDQILRIAVDNMPVTEKEVSENVRIFRPHLSGPQLRTLDLARELASRTGTGVPDKS